MPESITIANANELRYILEKTIAEAVSEFERRTELIVVGMDISRNEDGENVISIGAML